MNSAQRKYALDRVSYVERQKLDALRAETLIKGKSVSDEERFSLLNTRKVKLRPDVTQISSYTRVADVFDFSKYEWCSHPDPAKYDDKAAEIKADASRIRDQIMLGDAEEALRLLREFSA